MDSIFEFQTKIESDLWSQQMVYMLRFIEIVVIETYEYNIETGSFVMETGSLIIETDTSIIETGSSIIETSFHDQITSISC